MKIKKGHGPSLYYANDKNVFDALNEHKVDSKTIAHLFLSRNTIVGVKTSREDKAKYFSRLNHDYYDHKAISEKLGVVPRRERTTSMDIEGSILPESIINVANKIKQELESAGDVVQISRNGEDISFHVQYSTIDYKKNEFTQVQIRDGSIDLVKSGTGYTVRNTQNQYINDVREAMLGKLEEDSETKIEKNVVSLFDVPRPKLRSKFFHSLIHDLPGYKHIDVTDVYIYKAKPSEELDDQEEDGDEVELETHIERVFLRGNGVTRSELLNDLIEKDDYYIIKIGWSAEEVSGVGRQFDIEALFADPKDCTNFSFLLCGVFPVEDGKLLARRRPPTKSEIEAISIAIETTSRELVAALRIEYENSVNGE